MAEILTDHFKPRKLRPAHFIHDTVKPSSSQHKHDRHDRAYGQRSNGRLAPNHDLIGVGKSKPKSKDLEKAFEFIHGENLFPLNQETDKKSVPSKRKSLSERKERDFVVLETKAETEIKMRVPKIHEPRQRLKHAERVSPLKDVKRKLDFGGNDLALINDRETNELDFTDKIAALRSLLDTGFKTSLHSTAKNTGNSASLSNGTQPFQAPDKHVRKVAQITRSDSLKENGSTMELVVKRRKRREEARIGKEDKKNEKVVGVSDKIRGNKEEIENDKLITEVCDSRITDDRLSALTVDLHVLKDRLFEKRRNKAEERNTGVTDDRYLDKFIVKRKKVVERSNESPKAFQEIEVGDALDHVSPDRKVISSTKKFKPETKLQERDIVKSKSNLDSKKIQTDLLNQSMRSVQSNVPFYEPYAGLGGAVKRPASTLSSVKKKFYSSNNVEDAKEGMCEDDDIPETNKHLEMSSHSNAKQTNVDSFVGTSLTPEKNRDKGKTSPKVNNHNDFTRNLREDSNLNNAQKPEDGSENFPFENKGKSVTVTPKMGQADKKLNSEKSKDWEREKKIKGYKHLKGNLRNSETDTIHKEKIRNLGSIGIDKLHSEDEFLDHNFAQRIIENTNKTEKKVREWIKSQEKLEDFYPADCGPMTLEELSVSPSNESRTKEQKPTSPTDSYDRIPVKLEKWENEREKRSKHVAKHKYLNRVMPERHIGDHLEVLKDEATNVNGLEEEFPMRDLLPSKPKHHHSTESLDSASQ